MSSEVALIPNGTLVEIVQGTHGRTHRRRTGVVVGSELRSGFEGNQLWYQVQEVGRRVAQRYTHSEIAILKQDNGAAILPLGCKVRVSPPEADAWEGEIDGATSTRKDGTIQSVRYHVKRADGVVVRDLSSEQVMKR